VRHLTSFVSVHVDEAFKSFKSLGSGPVEDWEEVLRV